MPINRSSHSGVTLIELIAFIVIVGLALSGLMLVFNESIVRSVNPSIEVRALELAQSKMDEIAGRKYDGNTPTGGLPACGSGQPGASICAGIGQEGGSSDYDDVDDYNGFSSTDAEGYNVSVAVSFGGGDLPGVAANAAKRVVVTVTPPVGSQVSPVVLTSYLANY